MNIQENIPLRSKTTMKIGGTARYFAELKTKNDVEEAYRFSKEKNIPLIPLGGGSNTIFADGTIDALIVKIAADAVSIEGNRVTVQAGKYLATLINELAERNLDLSPLTGIPGTIGGAIFGNAGQGFDGIWIDTFVESVEVLEERGTLRHSSGQARKEEKALEWKIYSRADCEFDYRTSIFKTFSSLPARPCLSLPVRQAGGRRAAGGHFSPSSSLIWSCTLKVPSRPREEIKAEVERLLQQRIETQPHVKTAGSCFLSKSKEEPAWKLIDAAGLRGHRIGDIEVSSKHTNFLINAGNATYTDTKKLVGYIQSNISNTLHVEMRFIEEDGSLAF